MASTDLVFDIDDRVAEWAWETFKMTPVRYDMAVGVIRDNTLVGAVMFHAYSGPDIELSYYGPHTMTLGLARAMARVAVDYFGVSRVTARTSRKNKTMTRGIKKIGFQYEGIRKHGYGAEDAVMFGLYGKNLARLAGKAVH